MHVAPTLQCMGMEDPGAAVTWAAVWKARRKQGAVALEEGMVMTRKMSKTTTA